MRLEFVNVAGKEETQRQRELKQSQIRSHAAKVSYKNPKTGRLPIIAKVPFITFPDTNLESD